MTKVNTNVPAMIAKTSLNRNMGSLETALQRLSTGLRINSGKDDPAGLVASEILRSDITGINAAVRNTQRANMMIATADSALSEVANLLNDIRGLVTEAANTGAMSPEMIAANQLQVDASLDAIDRIAAQTTFMGKKLLDGSLDFDYTAIDRNDIQDLSVHQVTTGSQKGPIDINIAVRQGAEKAELYYNKAALAENLVLTWGGVYGYETESFQRGATVSEVARVVNASSNSTGVVAEVGSDALHGTMYTSSLGAGNDIIITAGLSGTLGGNVEIKYLKGTSDGIYVDYQEAVDANSPAKLLVYLQTEAYEKAAAKEVDTSPGVHDNNALAFTANIPGDQYNSASIHFVDGVLTQPDWASADNPTGTASQPYAYYNDTATRATSLFGDVNGMTNIAGLAGTGEYFTVQSKAAGSQYNDVAVTFNYDTGNLVPAGKAARAMYEETVDEKTGETTRELKVFYKENATLAQIREAMDIEGTFEMTASDASLWSYEMKVTDGYANNFDPSSPTAIPSGYGNTHSSGGDAGTLFIVQDPANPSTAGDIVSLFDLDSPASRGSERAASLFDVQRKADNDGSGRVRLYDVTSPEPPHDTLLKTRSSFDGIFKDGVTGGEVITTAAELVTALNNSAFWGTMLCPEVIKELTVENVSGNYYDATNPPIITARLAPGNHGLTRVAAFEEVAYYGDPNAGTALQFLGEKNSPNIRFVSEPGNDRLWIDRTTVPDQVDYAQSILTAANPNASLVFTANRKGGEYDDIRFDFKRVSEDVRATLDPNRKDGWVEYDPGLSQAEAHATFKTTAGVDIAHSAFFVTANERGDLYNDVQVVMTLNDRQADPVAVVYDEATRQLRVSLSSGQVGAPPTNDSSQAGWYHQITANDVIAAINNADLGFTAGLSYAQDQSQMLDLSKDPPVPLVDAQGNPYPPASNLGTGTFETIGLRTGQFMEVANTGDTGGHAGTVTVWLSDHETDPNDPTASRAPNANDVIRLISADQVVGAMFNARSYASGENAGTGTIDFVKDGPLVSSGGLVEKGTLTVHLVTNDKGIIQTTARDLVDWWQAQKPETVDNISVSLVRPAGAVWDDCNDPYGYGYLTPTVSLDDCDNLVDNDIRFVGWNDDIEQQYFVPKYASGTMTSNNGANASFDFVARRAGPDYNGYKIVYVDDTKLTGRYADNAVDGANAEPCDDDDPALARNDGGDVILPGVTTQQGLTLALDERTRTITINIRSGVTTAYDIEQLIENDPYTKNLFTITQKGTGTGLVSLLDSVETSGGVLPPGELNGAKLLFGADASEYFLKFKSLDYGSDQFVDVRALGPDKSAVSFNLQTADGKTVEKTYGKDIEALINGVRAVGSGLTASLNTSILSMDVTLSEEAGTNPNYATTFSIDGGGATYQVGPDVVSNQQLTVGIQSVNTVQLGGASGRLYQLRSGQDASLTEDTNKAFRIVEEALLAVTMTRGRFGTMQKATFDSNINILQDTLEELTTAESMIRDADFADESAKLTRAQILVQSNLSSLGIANQLPNYMLGLLGR